MPHLPELKDQIRQCELKGDLLGITKLRAQIARDFPGTADAAEALFRLGLYFLFVEGDVPAAIQTLGDAVKVKDPNWSKAARVSLASLYVREGKPQKALLELRKALGDKDPPSIHSVSALSIIESLHDQGGEGGLAREAKEEKVRHLEALLARARSEHDDGAAAYFLLSLGFEAAALQGPAAAKARFDEVMAMGAERAGPHLVKQAQRALKDL